jgi:hypothetical protein
VFNATFNHISITMSVLLVKETEVPGENHRPAASHALSHNVVSSTLCMSGIRTHIVSGDMYICTLVSLNLKFSV